MRSEGRDPMSCNCQPAERNGSTEDEPGPKGFAARAIQRGSLEQEGGEVAFSSATMASALPGVK